METKQLVSFTLLIVLVGMIIGVGIIVSDKFGSTTFYSRTSFNGSTFTPINNTGVATGVGNITTTYKIVNNTDQTTLDASCYTIQSTNGSIVLNIQDNATCSWPGGRVARGLFDYKDYNTAASGAMKNVTTEISNIASNWLGLIVTVGILSIIVVLVINSFGFGQGGKRQ